jgi:RND family efflux transporter MFP subunit
LTPGHDGDASPQRDPLEQEREAHAHHADVGSAPPVKPASTRRVVAAASVVLVVLVALLVNAFLPRRATSRELAADAAAPDPAPVVQVATVQPAANGGNLLLPGTIQPLHEGVIYARVGGYVKSWRADIGTVVRAGDVLARIDAPELDQQVQQAQHQAAQARAALGLAKADLDRWRALAADSAVSREELDQKSATYDAAVANTGAADANVRRLTEMQNFTQVTAPFAGVITARNVDIGSLITASGATSAAVATAGDAPAAGSLFRLAQTDTVRTYISVPESYTTAIAPGLVADVTVQELPGRTFTGHVVRTAHALDVSSRTLLTEIDVPNPGFSLLPGMYANVTMHLVQRTPPMLLPASALVIRSSGTQVMVLDNTQPGQLATVHLRPVGIGRDYGGTIEVTGLAAQTPVVADPSADLVDGMRVRIATATAAR